MAEVDKNSMAEVDKNKMAEIDNNGMAERTRSHQKRLVFLLNQLPSFQYVFSSTEYPLKTFKVGF